MCLSLNMGKLLESTNLVKIILPISCFDLRIPADGAAIHRSAAIKAFLQTKPGRIYLERLPAYSPELNPVELLWSQIKRSLKNQVFSSLEELSAAILEQIVYLEKNPKLVQPFFHKKDIGFITS